MVEDTPLANSWWRGDATLTASRSLVLRFGRNATSYQILNHGLSRWLSADGRGVVGYVETKGCRVVAGEPIAETDRVLDLANAFEEESRSRGLSVCYFGAEEPLASAAGTCRLLLGAQPTWHPNRWPEVLAGKASLRAQLSRALNKEVRVTFWPSRRASNDVRLSRCLE